MPLVCWLAYGVHSLLAGFEEAAAALAKVLDCPVEQLPADTMRALINDTSKSPLELAMLARLLQKELVKPSPAPQLAVSCYSACAAPSCDVKSCSDLASHFPHLPPAYYRQSC